VSSLTSFSSAVNSLQPRVAVVLGSGQSSVLGGLAETASVTFAEVPGLAVPSVSGHSGNIVIGALGDVPLVVFQGRLHFYEGHAWEKVAAPIAFAASLGVKTLLLTNAAGGIHPSLCPGSLMIVRDHLFWQRPGSWRGPGPETCACIDGAQTSPYSSRLIEQLHAAGQETGEALMSGVYAAVTGPCYETPAEIRALRDAGADAVGMSTAHECETGRALGMECAAISAITNKGAGLCEGTLDHKDVLQVMAGIRERLGRLIAVFVRRTR
jgi:purine-nucleoside phosphorylase